MKYLCLFFVITIVTSNDLMSQQFKRDTRLQTIKEDAYNMYQSDKVSNLDLIEALELSGIAINKFYFGTFDKQYNFILIIDEFKDGKIANSDTVLNDNNEYHYYTTGSKEVSTDYIDQLKIFSKTQDTSLIFYFKIYDMSFKKNIQFKKYDKNSYYYFRSYFDTKWSLNEKIPLLVYASSWLDKKGGFQRFCGVANLTRNSDKTTELLTSSPHYFMISYLVTEIK
jgi:hypothetical protein